MDKDHLYAVIIAGGRGKRFWPLSREAKPKQLLALDGNTSLLRQTVDRIMPLVQKERIFIVTAKSHAGGVLEEVPDLPRENILVEPVGKNTAPALAFSAAHLLEKDPDAVMAVLPSDHVIGQDDRFLSNITAAVEMADREPYMVTFGIRPTRPETGYGYIEVGEKIFGFAFRVNFFKEKPNRKKAKYYLDSGRYLWNSGMFVFRADVLMERIKICLPDLYSAWEIYFRSRKGEPELKKFYDSVEPISIDNGVMSKSGGYASVIPASFSWIDVGSWEAIDDIWEADEGGNRKSGGGNVVHIKSEGNTVVSGKLVALLGVNDLIVVETDDALLICKKDHSQEIKSLVREIERLGYSDYL